MQTITPPHLQRHRAFGWWQMQEPRLVRQMPREPGSLSAHAQPIGHNDNHKVLLPHFICARSTMLASAGQVQRYAIIASGSSPSAMSTAVSAWMAVVSNSGTALSSARTSSMFSVQPRMIACAPRSTSRAITRR